MPATIKSVTSTTVERLKFDTIADIPRLRAWFDASDSSTIVFENPQVYRFPDTIWQSNKQSYLTCTDVITLTGDFTAEGWVNRNSRTQFDLLTGYTVMFGGNDFSGAGNDQMMIDTPLSANEVGFSLENGAFFITTSSTPLTANVWQHIAYVRNSGIVSIFVDGKKQTTVVKNNLAPQTSTVTVKILNQWVAGQVGQAGYQYPLGLDGYCSNYRIVADYAVYTSDFNPYSTLPLLSTVSSPGWTPLLTMQNLSSVNLSRPANSLVTNQLTMLRTPITGAHVWLDKTTSQLSAYQTDITKRPRYILSGTNNLNALNFDGSNDFFALSPALTAEPVNTSFFVYTRPLSTNLTTVSFTNSATDDWVFLHHIDDNVYGANRYTGYDVLSSGTVVSCVTRAGSLSSYAFFDLYAFNKFGYSWTGTTRDVYTELCRRYVGSDYHKGYACELVHVPYLLPELEVRRVNEKLFNKWKVSTAAPHLNGNSSTLYISAINTAQLSSTAGSWFVEPTSTEAFWEASNSVIGPFFPISFDSNFIYDLQPADYGKYVRSRIRTRNSSGQNNAYSNVLQLTTVNMVSSTITRSTIFTVSATPGTWKSTVPFDLRYEWQISAASTDGWKEFDIRTKQADFSGDYVFTTSLTAYLSSYATGANVRVNEYATNSLLPLPTL